VHVTAAPGEPETLLEQYHRLQAQVGDLATKIQQMKVRADLVSRKSPVYLASSFLLSYFLSSIPTFLFLVGVRSCAIDFSFSRNVFSKMLGSCRWLLLIP